MFLKTILGLVGLLTLLWAARAAAHALILRGLRAPRLVAQQIPQDLGYAAQSVHVPGPNGKTLFAWFIGAPGVAKAPAVLVMHGWGANASMMLSSAAPLSNAGFAVLLLDARCHGASADEALTASVVQACAAWPQFSTAVNGRFKGGYITRHYGQPDQHIHAIQLEMCQSLYMQEVAPFAFDDARAALVQPLLAEMVSGPLEISRVRYEK